MHEKYTNNYKRNLIKYWQQFYPNWTIPKGFHVHHIKPQCTFEDENDLFIHHPRNLIALHPDDHQTIHRLRGDTALAFGFLSIKDRRCKQSTKEKISKANKGRKLPPRTAVANRKLSETNKGRCVSPATCAKISIAKTGIKRKPFTAQTLKNMSAGQKGRIPWNKGLKTGPRSEETKQKIREGNLRNYK